MKQEYFDSERFHEINISPDGNDFNCFEACFAQLQKTDGFLVFEEPVSDFLGDWSCATFTFDGNLVILLYWHWFGVELKMEKGLDTDFYSHIYSIADQLRIYATDKRNE